MDDNIQNEGGFEGTEVKNEKDDTACASCPEQDSPAEPCCPGSNRGQSTCCGASPSGLWKMVLWAALILAAVIVIVSALRDQEGPAPGPAEPAEPAETQAAEGMEQ